MTDGLVGYSGYVGSTLRRQRSFDRTYRSTDVGDIRNGQFNLLVCAGAPAQKWIANRDPEADRSAIDRLIELLATVSCDTFVLISTVDVFRSPDGVDEDTPVDDAGLHPYGLHRRFLEHFVETQFRRHLVVRLPGLVGPGLKKNVIFDLLNGNNCNTIDSRSVFQFYPMVNLWWDIALASASGLNLVHLTAEPLSVSTIAQLGFGKRFDHTVDGTPARYDMRSKYAALFGGSGAYQYSQRESLQAVRAYAQSEPKLDPSTASA
jgi:hypothetical protein